MILSLAVSGCSIGAKKEIKIGVVTSVTGALAGYADQEIKGLKLGIAYATNGTNKVLGRDIKLVIEDDTGDPAVGKQKATKLLEQDKVDILQGTAATPVALQVAEVAKQYQVIFMVDPAAGDQLTTTNFNKYIFRTGCNTSQDALTGGAGAASLGKTFVHLAPDNAFGASSQAAWDAVFKAFGATLLKDVKVPLEAKDFAVYIQQVIQLKPDFLMITWSGASALKLFQQLNELGVYQKMKVTTGVGDRAGLMGLGEGAVGVKGMVKYFHTLPKNKVNDYLVAEHKKLYNGDPPDLFTAGGMAAGIAIVKGIEKAGSTKADKMIPALEGMSFDGPKGTYTFRKEDHQALQPMYFVEIVKDPAFTYPIPKLIKEYSATETAPPVNVPK